MKGPAACPCKRDRHTREERGRMNEPLSLYGPAFQRIGAADEVLTDCPRAANSLDIRWMKGSRQGLRCVTRRILGEKFPFQCRIVQVLVRARETRPNALRQRRQEPPHSCFVLPEIILPLYCFHFRMVGTVGLWTDTMRQLKQRAREKNVVSP